MGAALWTEMALMVHTDPAPDRDPEEIPVGSIVRTPMGKMARVIGHRGYRRDHIVRLWLQYLEPENKRFDKVLLPPFCVVVVTKGED